MNDINPPRKVYVTRIEPCAYSAEYTVNLKPSFSKVPYVSINNDKTPVMPLIVQYILYRTKVIHTKCQCTAYKYTQNKMRYVYIYNNEMCCKYPFHCPIVCLFFYLSSSLKNMHYDQLIQQHASILIIHEHTSRNATAKVLGPVFHFV